jgi:MerR family transcriptional regulator, copper efflux regulator
VDGYRISQLAERTGVPATTLRFYENAGLLPADRTASGYRVYTEEAVERLGFIGAAKRLGLPLDEIAELLAVWEHGGCTDVCEDLRPRLTARIGEAQCRAAELAAFITTLHRAIEHIDTLPERTERCGPHCMLPDPGTPDPASALDPAPTVPDSEHWRTAPVACSLPSLGDRSHRAAQWTALLADAPRSQIPEGIRITLPAERAAQVADLAAAEQACCPFFGFRLDLDGPTLHLEVRAPADGAELLSTLFGQLLSTHP